MVEPITLSFLSGFLIVAGVLIGGFSNKKYGVIVGANLISIGLLGLFISASSVK